MTYVRLCGGLGNQLFQYAHGRNLELSGKSVIFNTSFFNGDKAKIDTARNFKLNNFNISTKTIFSEKKHPLINILTKISRKFGLKTEEFWQSEKYFKDIEEIVRQEFTLKNPLKEEGDKWKNKINKSPISVSLHIRRGDYVQNKEVNSFHGTCDISYYQKAVELIKEKINCDFEIYIFSDDIDWVKENLNIPYEMYFVSNPEIPDYEEMYLMSLCKHNIIANSSFSWWGAWLNQNPNKIVVAPNRWFNDPKANGGAKDIVPENWIKI